MNLKNVSDKKLIANAVMIAENERRRLSHLLHYIAEIDVRRLYADYGYSSLFDFMNEHLKYSEDQTCRRITAARMLKEIPEIAKKIGTGDLTITNVTIAELLFRREKKAKRPFSTERKREFLKSIENISSRAAERLAVEISPLVAKPDQVRPLSEDFVDLRCSLATETIEKMELIKDALAHTHGNLTYGELIDLLCDLQIANLKKNSPAAPPVTGEGENTNPQSRAAIRRAVWTRDKGICTNCRARRNVQIDHIKPKAMGGPDTLDNLRLLCRNCNQRWAIILYGQAKMDEHLQKKFNSFDDP